MAAAVGLSSSRRRVPAGGGPQWRGQYRTAWPTLPLGINLNWKGKLTVAPWQSIESRWHGHLRLTALGPQNMKARALLRKAIIMVHFGLSLKSILWWESYEGQFGKDVPVEAISSYPSAKIGSPKIMIKQRGRQPYGQGNINKMSKETRILRMPQRVALYPFNNLS